MASRTVQLWKYVKVDGKWKYLKAVFYPNFKIKPHALLVNKVEQTIKNGYYALSCGRGWLQVGNGPKKPTRLSCVNVGRCRPSPTALPYLLRPRT
jgi:hypothetical protein